MADDVSNLLTLGLVIAAVVIIKDLISSVEDTLGITPLPTSQPPAPPVYQGVKFDPNCPAGYISDSDGNCIQVTGAIHQ